VGRGRGGGGCLPNPSVGRASLRALYLQEMCTSVQQVALQVYALAFSPNLQNTMQISDQKLLHSKSSTN
jgi:hypothetical protein